MSEENPLTATESKDINQIPYDSKKNRKRFSKQEFSWMLYDWANSTYATNIMAAIFPIYFTNVCDLSGAHGDQMWGFGTALATLIVAFLAPFLGAIGDYKGMKKKLLSVFVGVGVVFTFMMAVTDNWKLMLVGYIISYIGFTGANLFYDSFLTDVTTEDRMDKVSSYGYAMGYIGGSTIPFLISIAIIISPFGEDNKTLAVKIAVVITCIWWALFSIPILRNVHQMHYVEVPQKKLVVHTLRNVGSTALAIFANKGIFVFILAYFFYIDGVNTVIHMATAYGAVFHIIQPTRTEIRIYAYDPVCCLHVYSHLPCRILYGNIH
jgi:UMF1 family MFS transporter